MTLKLLYHAHQIINGHNYYTSITWRIRYYCCMWRACAWYMYILGKVTCVDIDMASFQYKSVWVCG